MKKWLVGGAAAIVCIVAACIGVVVYTFSQIPQNTPSIGIIGGADGPTVAFITWKSGLNWVLLTGGILILLILLLVAGVAIYKSRKKA